MDKNKGGRPKKYTEELTKQICQKIDEYTDSVDIPILAEFCYQNDIRKQTLYEHAEFSDSIKALIEKKEAQLERKALNKEIDHTMAIFSLKQLGWTDKQEIQHSGQIIYLPAQAEKEGL